MKKLIFMCFFCIVLTVFMLTVFANNEKEESKKQFQFNRQYKRIHRKPWQYIKEGNIDKAIEYLLAYLDKNPDDAETYFMLTLAYVKLEKPEKAIEAMKHAVEAELPVSRFVASNHSIRLT